MKRRILIASQDQDVQELAKEFATAHELEANFFSQSAELMSQAMGGDFALLLIDEAFPLDPNADWTAWTRGEDHRIIRLTGATSDHIPEGAHGYLRKPLHPIVFSTELHTHLRVVELSSRLREMATHDELTGSLSRESFLERFEDECKRAWRYRMAFSVLMLTIDRLSEIEHEYGESVATELLIQVADKSREQLRDTDCMARWNGTDFAILLPETALGNGLLVAARLRARLSELAIYMPDDEKIRITTSIGMAGLSDDDIKDCEQLTKNAERALESAGEQGRNGVFFHAAGSYIRFAEVGV